MIVGGLSRVVDTVDVCLGSWRSLETVDSLMVRPVDDTVESLESFLFCVAGKAEDFTEGAVEGNWAPYTSRFVFVEVVLLLLLLMLYLQLQ